ncbi:alanine:cation symporter family protein [Bacillus sp. CB102A.1]
MKYRVSNENGEYSGGQCTIRTWFRKEMACCFIRHIRTTASFGIGNMVQSNSVAEAMRINFSFPPALTGILMSFLIAIVILGGVKKIGKVTGYIVPIKAFFYIIAGLIIIFYHYDQIPEAFSLIFSGAFTGTAAAGFIGATVASAIQIGMARVYCERGWFRECPYCRGGCKNRFTCKASISFYDRYFLDTFIVCTITGLVLITTGAWKSGKTGVEATTLAFQSVFVLL